MDDSAGSGRRRDWLGGALGPRGTGLATAAVAHRLDFKANEFEHFLSSLTSKQPLIGRSNARNC